MFIKRKIVEILNKYAGAPEAIVLTGFRRVGKTAVMKHIYDTIASDNKLFLDLESPVNQKIFEEDNYDNIKSAFTRLGLDTTRSGYVFLDEIQYTKNIPSVIKYLIDHYRIKFYLTGSSSFYLKNLFSESLAGRKYLFELYPLDFEEFLWFKGAKIGVDAGHDLLSGLYEEFLQFGGFPGVVLKENAAEKQLALDDVLGSYFQLDVKHLAHFHDNQNLKKLLFLLSGRVGSKPEMGKLAESLGVTRQTVATYLNFFEQTYLIHLLTPLSGSKDIEIRMQPKVYFVDTGILNRIGQVSRPQVFENKIFNQLYTGLKRAGVQSALAEGIHYYQLKTGAEIDFVVEGKRAYEVKTHGSTYDVKRLSKVARSLGFAEYCVVTLDKVKGKSEYMRYPYAL